MTSRSLLQWRRVHCHDDVTFVVAMTSRSLSRWRHVRCCNDVTFIVTMTSRYCHNDVTFIVVSAIRHIHTGTHVVFSHYFHYSEVPVDDICGCVCECLSVRYTVTLCYLHLGICWLHQTVMSFHVYHYVLLFYLAYRLYYLAFLMWCCHKVWFMLQQLCLSVSLSVRLSVTFIHCIEVSKNYFCDVKASPFLLFHTKHGEIRQGHLHWRLNTG